MPEITQKINFAKQAKSSNFAKTKLSETMRYSDWYKELQKTFDERDIAYITHRMQSPSSYENGDFSALASPLALAYDFASVGKLE